jgi:hypothetical protein
MSTSAPATGRDVGAQDIPPLLRMSVQRLKRSLSVGRRTVLTKTTSG